MRVQFLQQLLAKQSAQYEGEKIFVSAAIKEAGACCCS